MRTRSPHPVVLVIVPLLVGLSGCDEDGTAPDLDALLETMNPAGVSEALHAMARPVEANQELLLGASLALYHLQTDHGVQPGPAADMLRGLPRPEPISVFRVPGARAPFRPFVEFPASVLGKTFVYDRETERYEADPDRTGAPANGVRVVLYRVEVFWDAAAPLLELGYADLTPANASTASGLAVEIVRMTAAPTTVVEVVRRRSVPPAGVGVYTRHTEVVGHVRDSEDRVDLHIEESLRFQAGGFVSTVSAELDDATTRWRLERTSLWGDVAHAGDGTITVTQPAGTIVLRFMPTSTDGVVAIQGELSFNGTMVAVLHIDAGDFLGGRFTKPGGGAFTAAQRARLEALLSAMLHVGSGLYFFLFM